MDGSRSHKMVLVWRKDLKVRKGKLTSQMAHAAFGAFFTDKKIIEQNGVRYLAVPLNDKNEPWINGIFTKVSVTVNSEEELLAIYNRAKDLNIPCALIQDAGLTEFGGIPTYTAVGIGPDRNEVIDQVTKDLPLL